MIKIRDIQDTKADVYHNNEYIGTINNQYQLNDVRLQIKEQKLSGVHFVYRRDDNVEERIDCNSDGHMSNWPKGFFDLMEKQLYSLINWH